MEKSSNPPPYEWNNGHTLQPPPAAPPSYSQAVGGVGPSSPYTPQYPPCKYAKLLNNREQVNTFVINLFKKSPRSVWPIKNINNFNKPYRTHITL